MLGLDVKKIAVEITEEVTQHLVRDLNRRLDTLHADLRMIIGLLERGVDAEGCRSPDTSSQKL